MSGTDFLPATPDEYDATTPSTPGSDVPSDPSTPFDENVAPSPGESHKRVPSLPPLSDPHNMNPNSTAMGLLGRARVPPQTPTSFAGGAGASMDNNIMAKARALHQQRLQKAGSPAVPGAPKPQSPVGGGPSGGFQMQLPGGAMQRPPPPNHPNSAPVVPKSLSERRAAMGRGPMKLPDMNSPAPATGGMRRKNAPSLSDMGADTGEKQEEKPRTKMDDFKKYIDADKGWITFDGAATITREGVNFHNGQTFKISLDEVEIMDELGKGNYGTVYMAKHSKPKAPRFGHGLSGMKPPLAHTQSDSTIILNNDKSDGTTGVVMAMKEIRLELDDAKFTTILKELVILHQCVSPYIIDFYGAFFQDGAVYMCIEYMDGGSIDKLYAGGIPEGVLRKITYSTVMGLKSLKDEHNIIHRDVKPTNILVNTRGQVKICDFGVSGNLVASIAKTNIGCQSYMAPERISGGGMAPSGNQDGTYSVQSDIWSLGLTVIECAMGMYPYPAEVSSTIFSQLSAIVEGEPPELPEGYSDIAKDFVKGCLHKIPKSRPTYAALLKHPFIKEFAQIAVIQEEPEEGDEAEQAAEAVGKMHLGGTEDEEVADWVNKVLKSKSEGTLGDVEKPALHAVPLDTVSPMTSPAIGSEPSGLTM